MRYMKRYEKHILTFVVMLFYIVGYFVITSAVSSLPSHTLFSSWDRELPLRPGFIYVYLQVYFIVFLPVFLTDRISLIRKFACAYMVTMICSYALFIIFPVVRPRPDVELVSFNSFCLSVLYRLDHPTGCFPSLHVAMATLASLCTFSVNRAFGIFSWIMTLLIALSTLFIKQHFAADVISGAFLACLSYLLVKSEIKAIVLQPLFKRTASAEQGNHP